MGHPELDQYDHTIWADNRVKLRPAALELFGASLDNHQLVIPQHSYRTSVRREYEEVIASG